MFEWSAPAGSQFVLSVKPFLAGAAGASWQEPQARFAWLTTVLLNLLVPLFAIICFGYVAHRSLAPQQLLPAAGAVAILSIGSAVLLFVGIATESALHRLIFDFTFDALRASNRFSGEFLQRVLILLWAINALAVVAPSCAVVTFVATVVPPNRPETVGDLRSRTRRLRETLNASAALLVSGILHMGAWLRWSAALVDGKTARESIEHLTLSVTLFWGMAFTLMIVAAFVPATLILRERALHLYRQTAGEPGGDLEKWLGEQGFKFSVGDQLPQIAVMLAPLLAGPAASLFGAVTNWGQ